MPTRAISRSVSASPAQSESPSPLIAHPAGALGAYPAGVLVSYPAGALVRVREICGDRKSGRPGLLPIVPRTWYKWLNEQKIPPGVKLSENCTAWPIEVILAIAEKGLAPASVER